MVFISTTSVLFIIEAHILEEVNKCAEAMQQNDAETLDSLAGAIRGRIARVENVVIAEMENYERGPFTETVTRAVMVMKNNSKLVAVTISLLHFTLEEFIS